MQYEMKRKRPVRPYATRAIHELKHMIKALSMYSFFNTEEENLRLANVKAELRMRG